MQSFAIIENKPVKSRVVSVTHTDLISPHLKLDKIQQPKPQKFQQVSFIQFRKLYTSSIKENILKNNPSFSYLKLMLPFKSNQILNLKVLNSPIIQNPSKKKANKILPKKLKENLFLEKLISINNKILKCLRK